MLGSLVLISLLSTSLVAQLTVEQLEDTTPITTHGLAGVRRAAAPNSSGAEFLTAAGLTFQTYDNLEAALTALSARQTDAVVNSVGALQWAMANGFSRTAAVRTGLLAPALMGFAICTNSALLVPLDDSMVRITTSEDWAAREKSYFANWARITLTNAAFGDGPIPGTICRTIEAPV
jgi:polar amino acid transport system substrate-binding protein